MLDTSMNKFKILDVSILISSRVPIVCYASTMNLISEKYTQHAIKWYMKVKDVSHVLKSDLFDKLDFNIFFFLILYCNLSWIVLYIAQVNIYCLYSLWNKMYFAGDKQQCLTTYSDINVTHRFR